MDMSHCVGMCEEVHNVRKVRRLTGKKIHFILLIELLSGPGADDRITWCLREFPTHTVISTNFINCLSGSIRDTPNMRQLLMHLGTRKAASSFVNLFEIPGVRVGSSLLEV